jgi:hypothetical protein
MSGWEKGRIRVQMKYGTDDGVSRRRRGGRLVGGKGLDAVGNGSGNKDCNSVGDVTLHR